MKLTTLQLKKRFAKQFKSFTFFFRYLRYRIFIALILSTVVGILDGFGLSMFLPLLQLVNDSGSVDPESMGNLRFLVDGIEGLGISLNLVSVLLLMVCFFTLKGIFQFLSIAYITIVKQFFMRSIREDLLDKLNRIGYKHFVQADAGRIQNTMTGEVLRIATAYQSYFRSFEQSILVVVYMGFAFFVDAQFALLITVGGILTNLLYRSIYKRTKGASIKRTVDSHIYEGQVMQHIGNFKYLKATGKLKEYAQMLKRSIQSIEKTDKKIGILNGILQASREPLLIIVVTAVMLIHTNILGQSLGPVLISLLFFYRALTAVISVQQSWNIFVSVSGSLDNMTSFQNELNRKIEYNGEKEFVSFRHKIELKDVGFNYSGEEILHNISLDINKNETVAFVGESGSGKTTLVNILAGLLTPDEGQMIVDGLTVDTINRNSYQNRIGYITQEPVIFNDTIFNNVSFWADPTEQNCEKCRLALKKAAINRFVNKLPDGIRTLLGNNGINLSGGQRQRISIARELYKDIDILIMDEATSSLDSETEKSIQESMETLKGKYTILIVAHRLSTVKHADRLVFLNEGRIEFTGHYSSMLDKSTSFRRMVELQEL